MDGRLTITDVARAVGVTTRTIMRWEKSGKIKKPKRDWRGWRFYHKDDLAEIKQFFETSYEFNEEDGKMIDIPKGMLNILLATSLAMLTLCGRSYAETNFAQPKAINEAVTETQSSVEINLDELPVIGTAQAAITEAVKYTVGPDDVIAITVRRHPEFSGQYTINSEGKIEYKFVGDIIVSGLTKPELKERLTDVLSEYIIEPEIDVSIVAYLSKVCYVVGEVGSQGKLYMKADTITVREALVQSGLPNGSASMRACRLITPNETGKYNYVNVNVYRLLYKGDLSWNLEMKPGDVLYVPSTVMDKIIRVISPVSGAIGGASGLANQGAGIVP